MPFTAVKLNSEAITVTAWQRHGNRMSLSTVCTVQRNKDTWYFCAALSMDIIICIPVRLNSSLSLFVIWIIYFLSVSASWGFNYASQKLETGQYPTLFRILLQSVLEIFQDERHRLQDSGCEVVLQEFKLCLQQRILSWSPETKWWSQIPPHAYSQYAHIFLLLLNLIHSLCLDIESCCQIFSGVSIRDLWWTHCIASGMFNAARCSSIAPENLIDSTKLYDYM